MRFTLVAALTLSVLVAVTGCTREVSGTAQPDPSKPAVKLTRDGYGIVTGFTDARVRLEILTDPQCPPCALLQEDFGDDLRRYIGTGQLMVTYRPMTLLDGPGVQYSARVANALFVAVDPGTSGTAFQQFVRKLWTVDSRSRRGPSDDDMAELAREAGVPSGVAHRIGDGEEAVDVDEMADANLRQLAEINRRRSTPTVYDVTGGAIINIADDDWLDDLMTSK